MSKYTLEFKLQVVQYYLEGVVGSKRTGRAFGIECSSVRKWVSAYKQHGIEGIKPREQHKQYTADFKEKVILDMRQNSLTYLFTAAKFNIPSLTTIKNWEERYNTGGIEALKRKTKREFQGMKKPRKINSLNKKDDLKTTNQLLAEIQYLRAENAYLKKLSALIQKKK